MLDGLSKKALGEIPPEMLGKLQGLDFKELSMDDIRTLPRQVLDKLPNQLLSVFPKDIKSKLTKTKQASLKTLSKLMTKDALSVFPVDWRPLPRQNLFLGELISKGVLGFLFPLLLAAIFLGAGFIGDVYDFQWNIVSMFLGNETAKQYSYWVSLITIGAYLLAFYAGSINLVLKEAHKALEIDQRKSERWQKILLGPIAEIAVPLLAIPFIYFDSQSFQATLGLSLDSIRAMTFAWYGILIFSWIYVVAFIWLSLGLLIYMGNALKKTTWRIGIDSLIQTKRYRKLINAMILVYIPLLPYAIVKLLFQFLIVPSSSDYIATFILMGCFIGGIFAGPILVSNDVKLERKGFLNPQRNKGLAYVKSVTSKVLNNEKLKENDVMKAMLVNMNTNNIQDSIKERIMDSELVKKLIAMVSAPLLAYLSQITQDGSLLNTWYTNVVTFFQTLGV